MRPRPAAAQVPGEQLLRTESAVLLCLLPGADADYESAELRDARGEWFFLFPPFYFLSVGVWGCDMSGTLFEGLRRGWEV